MLQCLTTRNNVSKTVEKIFRLDACLEKRSKAHDDQDCDFDGDDRLSAGCPPAAPLIQTAATATTMRAEQPASTGQPVNDGWQPNERLLPAPQSEYEGVHKLRASRQGLTHLADSQTLLRRKMLDPKTEIVIAGGWDFTCKKDAISASGGQHCIAYRRLSMKRAEWCAAEC